MLPAPVQLPRFTQLERKEECPTLWPGLGRGCVCLGELPRGKGFC